MKTSYHDNILYGASMIAGQAMSAASTFFWDQAGTYTVNGSTILILGMIFWALGLVGLFGSIQQKLPIYSRLGLVYGFYGCLGGIAFGFEGLYATVLGESKIGVGAYQQFPMQMNLVLFWAGPAFPLTLFMFGIVILWRRVYSLACGLLMVAGAIGFPVSRILRKQLVAHTVDLLLLAAVVMVAIEMLQSTKDNVVLARE
jgi:hypothetical protein